MDSDTQTLETALAALRQRFGSRLAGSINTTQAQMRGALTEQLGVNDLLADRLVKKLTETGRLRNRATGADTGDGPAPAAEPVGVNSIAAGTARAGGGGGIPGDAAGADEGGDARGRGARADAENRTGATAGGQLADTNVTGPSTPIEAALAGGPAGDDAAGYWQIG